MSTNARSLLVPALFLIACGDVEAPAGDMAYLPLSSMSTDEAKTLTEGGDAEGMHTHAYLPLSAMSVEQAKKLTTGLGETPDPPGGGETGRTWEECGTIDKLNNCELPGFSGLEYEYGVVYNTNNSPNPVICTQWNHGFRLYNRTPYFVVADDPLAGMQYGGTMFYRGTDSADDDTCPANTWRHHYWALGANNKVEALASNGCYGAGAATGDKLLKIYCRRM